MILEAIIAVGCVAVVTLVLVLVLCAIAAVMYSARWDEEREAAWRDYLKKREQADG